MSRDRIRALVRQFTENGIKMLLENSRNVRELLAIGEVSVLDLIDFDHMRRVPTSFVQRDYRHVEADVVLRAPLRRPGKQRGKRTVTIYILIEHQSQPDYIMALRVLDYVVQIYKSQVRDWLRRHRSLAGRRLQPVLPVVLYTGLRRWEGLGQLADLVEMAPQFDKVIPALDPLFLNVSALSADALETRAGFFSWVLRLIQQRQSRATEFQRLLGRVVEHLEIMPAAERTRWLELLSYVQALVYHERDPSEHAGLQREVEASVRTDQHRQEVSVMGKTIADELIDKGMKRGRKEEAVRARRRILLDLLQERFGELPQEIVATIESSKSIEQLDAWLRRFAKAVALEEVGIGGS